MTDAKSTWNGMDLQDRMLACGGVGMAVLAFFPWFSVTFENDGLNEMMKSMGGNMSSSSAGIDAWHGWMAVIFGVACALWVFAPQIFAGIQQPTRQFIPLGVSGLGFVLGPAAFFARSDSASNAMVDAGPTFWLWLALACGAAAVGGAAWKKFGTPG